MKNNYFLLFSLVLFLGCGKSPESQKISVIPDSPFHSKTLSSHFDKHILNTSLEQFDFDHYLALYRFKQMSNPEDAFIKIVYGASTLSPISLSINETHLAADENIVAYTFSNEWFPFLINGLEADHLPQDNFNEVEFTFNLNDELSYEGSFPDPGSFLDENTDVQIENISKGQGKALKWSPSLYSDSYVKIAIIHQSTTGTELSSIQEWIVEDSGEFNLTDQQLSEYTIGDEISISLIRDVFLQQEKILIRGVEEQYWDRIKIID